MPLRSSAFHRTVPVVFVALACAAANEPSDGGPSPNGYSGRGASAGEAAGASGSATSTSLGGAQGVSLGGASGSSGAAVGGAGNGGTSGVGAAGRVSSSGGAAATTGRGGRGGRLGSGGAPSSAGKAGSSGASSVDLPPVQGATFTDVYTEVISVNCFGSGCHNPSMGKRPDFSTQSGTYNYFKSQGQLYPGQDPQKSYIYSIMHGNPSSTPPTPPYMPPSPNPNVPPEALAIVAGWIAAGAQNN